MAKRNTATGGLRTSLGMALNLLLLLAMVATNLLSLYHLTTTASTTATPPTSAVPDRLLLQLRNIRSTIAQLQHSKPSTTAATKQPPSKELVLYSKFSSIATSCHRRPDLLNIYMTYTPFAPCPAAHPPDLVDLLLLHGCHPLPRRRCFSTSPPSPVLADLPPPSSNLDLSIPQLLRLAKDSAALPIRIVLDVAGGTGELASRMREYGGGNATILTTTMNLGGVPNGQASARRGAIPLHSPLQQRFPLQDGVMDLVRCGRAVNRWIPTESLEFLLFDVDRVLRTGGLLWVDHFFCKAGDLEKVYGPVIKKLGYKILKWTTGNKGDTSGLRNGEIYLTALLQKHPTK